MKITDIETIKISIPAARFESALGVFPTFDYGIVVVHTDDGLEGLGEISSLWDGNGHLQCHFVEECFKPALIGQDPLAINHCLKKISTAFEKAHPARAGVEMALFDLLGKSLNTPVYNLLGGKVRDFIVLSHSISMGPLNQMVDMALKYKDEGFSCVKVKVGLDLDKDYQAVATIRNAVGSDMLLRVDANMGWRTPKDAIRAIKRLEEWDLHSVEQPLAPNDLEGLKLVRQSVDVPIMVDESLWGPEDAWTLLSNNVTDMMNIYVAESGGLINASLIFRMAELVGVPCVIGAMPELGIGTAAAVHLGVSMTNLNDPCDACGSIYQIVDVTEEPLVVKDGKIWAPTGPGLGVTLDRKNLEKYRVK